MKKATQSTMDFNNVAIVLIGDFDQEPPIRGASLPRLAMLLLQKECEEKDGLIRINKRTKQERFKMKSQLSQHGVRLFEKAGQIN